MTAYSEIREAVSNVVRHGSVSAEALFGFLRAIDKVEFLFGHEVKAYIDKLYHQLLVHQEAETVMNAITGADRTRAIDRKYEAFRVISDFYKTFPPLMSPYVRMDQKVPFWRMKAVADWCRAKRRR